MSAAYGRRFPFSCRRVGMSSSSIKDSKRLLSKSSPSNVCLVLVSASVLPGGPLCDMDCFPVTGGENGHLIIFNGCLRWIPLQWCHAICMLGQRVGKNREDAHEVKRLWHSVEGVLHYCQSSNDVLMGVCFDWSLM